ncbi:hypothetical protein EJ03DRAFT_242572, partial [Teratosphaeria nubilosa]
TSKCHNCHKPGNTPTQPLKTCRGCCKAWYCGRECQKKDWKRHRTSCHARQAAPSGNASTPSGNLIAEEGGQDDTHAYYN